MHLKINYKNSSSQTNPLWNGVLNDAVLPLTPDPDTWLRAGKDSCAWSPKIDLSHFTSWCCCSLPWPTLTWTTAPLLASVCSGESPAPHNPQPKPTLNTALHLSTSLQLCISFCCLFLYGSLLFFSSRTSFSVVMFCSVFLFPVYMFPGSFYSTITHPPVRSIYLCVAESFSLHRTPLYATVMESSPPLSSLLSFTGSSSRALSLTELLLTFCLLTHFKFN